MGGICGITGENNNRRIEAMVSAMSHRGPDDSGTFRDNGIALGAVRRVIVGSTPACHQPMSNTDGSVRIVYDGETYNFQEERDILRKKGHSFHSESDTEVVLKMYEQYGDDFLLRMRGIFALAIHDKRRGPGRERLLLARDQMGIKPLLHARVSSTLIFASEMKSMLASGLIRREFDPEALRLLLTHGSITQPKTAVSGVSMLLPGHRLIVESGTQRLERFWRLGTDRVPGLRNRPYEELVRIVKETLEESVRLRMIGDLPVGAFLSGGVDSALMVAVMSRVSGTQIKTFSVGFEKEGAHIDETDDACRMAKFLGADHTRIEVTGQMVRDRITHIASALDQPSVDGANSYFAAMGASKTVTVAFNGTGGDELFAGYPWFMNMAAACRKDMHNRWISGVKKTVSVAAQHKIFNPLLQGRFGHILEKLRASSGFVSRYARQYQIFGASGTFEMLAPEILRSSRAGREPAHDMAPADELPLGSPIERVSALCLRSYTQNQLLRDTDAAYMAHSLGARVPFLDHVLVDMALSLPDDAKLSPDTTMTGSDGESYGATGAKRILIDAAHRLLPEGMALRQKRGFGMPFDNWLKGALRDVVDDTLSPASVNKRGYFNAREVLTVRDNFRMGKTNWVYPWLLVITELWCRKVLDKYEAYPH